MEKVILGDEINLELSIGIDSSKQYYYYIVKKDTNEKIGTCGIRLSNIKDIKYLGNIEYEVYPPYQGHHYAEKAVRLITKIAVENNCNELSITARPTNKPSIKTIENLGATFIEVVKVPRSCRLYKENKYLSIYNLHLKGDSKNDRYKIN